MTGEPVWPTVTGDVEWREAARPLSLKGSLVSSQIFMALLSCIGACPRALCFPGGSAGEEPAHSAGDLASIPGWGGSPREGNGYPLRYSGLENSTGCIVCGVSQSWTRPSDFHFPGPLSGFPLSRMSLISTRGPPILPGSAHMSIPNEPVRVWWSPAPPLQGWVNLGNFLILSALLFYHGVGRRA